ncbi:MAG TPA: hypothetical protein EYP16_05460, partial [Candidatus Atribacteria bacterium]|nr:hypothetical protein [Candidatus Atribacteria bacterium]
MNRKKIIFLIFVFILFFGNYGWGITEVLLTRDKVVVSDTNVYLGDIAEIKGDLEHTLVTLRIIMEAIELAGYIAGEDIVLALDVA